MEKLTLQKCKERTGDEMNNQIQIFENSQFGAVRALEINGEPWFVGKDVATVLGYSNVSDALLKHVAEEDRVNSKTQSQNTIKLDLGQRGGWLINESGLYSLIITSELKTAKQFKRWITSEVLPSIRKHGAYMTENTIQKALTNPDFLIQLATQLKEEQEARRVAEQTIEEQKPKALFADAVATANTSILIGDLAKLLKQNGIDMSQKRLFVWLRENGYLIKREGADRNSPTQRSMEQGLFEIKETAITHSDGHVTINKTTKVTGKGQIYFINKFLHTTVMRGQSKSVELTEDWFTVEETED